MGERSMSDIGKEILGGLRDAVNYMNGTADGEAFSVTELTPAHAPAFVDVKALRERMGLSQAKFAAVFGLSLYTLRNWEQGRRQPDPAARAYLKVISAAPDVVRKALMA